MFSCVPASAKEKSKKKVSLEIVKANKKVIKYTFVNNRKQDYYVPLSWKLKKKVNGEWKTVTFKKNAKFSKTLLTVKPGNKNFIGTIQVKKFFPKKLKSGKYKLKISKYSREFRIS